MGLIQVYRSLGEGWQLRLTGVRAILVSSKSGEFAASQVETLDDPSHL
jgi:hypothetical protein